jgi:hypothetical protein
VRVTDCAPAALAGTANDSREGLDPCATDAPPVAVPAVHAESVVCPVSVSASEALRSLVAMSLDSGSPAIVRELGTPPPPKIGAPLTI